MKEEIQIIKSILKNGSINIFGLPMSGKDTVGMRLAKEIGANFLSSGSIIRDYEEKHKEDLTSTGNLIPTNIFYDIVLPSFYDEKNKHVPLILSSIGRWQGEEDKVMEEANNSNHKILAVIYLNISEEEAKKRHGQIKIENVRGERKDDANMEILENRFREFQEKTIPVIKHYEDLGLLININAEQSRDNVYEEVIIKLSSFLQQKQNKVQ